MKKQLFIAVLIMSVLSLCPSTGYASADPGRVTIWNHITDYVSTVGMSAQGKMRVRKQRQQQRRKARLDQQSRKKSKRMKKKMEKQQQIIMDKIHKRSYPHGRKGADVP